MYCIKCGVELADSEKVCPLCGTPVFHPDLPCGQGEPPYPPDHRPRVDEVSRAGVLFVLTVLFVLPAVISVLCDWRMGNGIVWSGYVVGGLVVLYVAVVLPLWFKRPNPAIFVPIDFIVIGLYLFYINFARTLVPDLCPAGDRCSHGAGHHDGGAAALCPRRRPVYLRRRTAGQRRLRRAAGVAAECDLPPA